MSAKTWYRVEQAKDASGAAEIFIYDEIGFWGVTANEFVKDLRAVKAGTVKLHVNSPGGGVDDGIAIYNALKGHKAALEVYVDGIAASAASFIAQAAPAGKLFMAPHTRMMIHEAWSYAAGPAEEMRKTAERLESLTKTIANIYAERSGLEQAHWLELMAAESWFTDSEAVEAGLADAIARDGEENSTRSKVYNLGPRAGQFRNVLSRYRNTPKELLEPSAGVREFDRAQMDRVHAALTAAVELHEATCSGEECAAGVSEASAVVEEEATAEVAELEQGEVVEEAGEATGGDPEKAPEEPKDVLEEAEAESRAAAVRREVEEALAGIQLVGR